MTAITTNYGTIDVPADNPEEWGCIIEPDFSVVGTECVEPEGETLKKLCILVYPDTKEQ